MISERCGIVMSGAADGPRSGGCDSHERSDRRIPAALSGCRAGEEYMLGLHNELLSAPKVYEATALTNGSAKVTQN